MDEFIPTLADLIALPKTFTLDAFGEEVEPNFVDGAEGTSNGISYELVPQDEDLVFVSFSNEEPTEEFNELPGAWEAIHVASNFELTFESPVKALLVATANDSGEGDGYDFGIVPQESIDIELDGTFMGSLDRGGTLALLVADEPTDTWISDSDDDEDDGIDLAFFAYPELPEGPTSPTDGPDFLFGTNGGDRLNGGAGGDFIDAGAGADTVQGGPGDDVLRGGDDSDVLITDDGADALEGGAGADVFAFLKIGDIAGESSTVRDFTPSDGDRIAFDDQFFDLGDGGIDPRGVTQAQVDAALRTGRVEYDRETGDFLIDGDGRLGPEDAAPVAVLEGGPGFSAEDVILF